MGYRYLLESAIILPGVVFAFLPLLDCLSSRSRLLVALCALIAVPAYALLRWTFSLSWTCEMLMFLPVVLAAHMLMIDATLGRKLLCFCNALMLCTFCPLYSVFIIAPKDSPTLNAAVCLGLSFVVGAIFLRTLAAKIPMLMRQEYISSVWEFLFVAPLLMSVLLWWAVPLHPELATVGKLKPVALVMLWLVLMVIWLLYHVFWWTAAKLTEGARLREENTLLMMEGKRYRELRSYMDSTRELRHDFRHHMLVISGLAGAGKFCELEKYIGQLTEKADSGYTGYCGNAAVDAVASHYTSVAEKVGVSVEWHMNLPSVLPMNEAEYCGVLGNLVENAIRSASEWNGRVKVVSSLLSGMMIGLSVDNDFRGEIDLGKDGLPMSGESGHGIGLRSVRNTVERYGGTLELRTEGEIFSVNIVFYCGK